MRGRQVGGPGAGESDQSKTFGRLRLLWLRIVRSDLIPLTEETNLVHNSYWNFLNIITLQIQGFEHALKGNLETSLDEDYVKKLAILMIMIIMSPMKNPVCIES